MQALSGNMQSTQPSGGSRPPMQPEGGGGGLGDMLASMGSSAMEGISSAGSQIGDFLSSAGTQVHEGLQDPNVNRAVLDFGTQLMQPRPEAQTSMGQLGQAINTGVSKYDTLEQQQQEQEAQAAQTQFEQEATERELGQEDRELDLKAEEVAALNERRRAQAEKFRAEMENFGADPDKISTSMGDARILARIAHNNGEYDTFDEALKGTYEDITANGVQNPSQWYADKAAEIETNEIMTREQKEAALERLQSLRDTLPRAGQPGRRDRGGDEEQGGGEEESGQGDRGGFDSQSGRIQRDGQPQPGDTINVGGTTAEIIDIAPDGRMRVRAPDGREAIVNPGE